MSVVQNIDVNDWKGGGTTWGVGAEVALLQVLFVRAGNFQEDFRRIDEFCFGLGAAAPLGSVTIRVDYATSWPSGYLGPNPDRFSMLVNWTP